MQHHEGGERSTSELQTTALQSHPEVTFHRFFEAFNREDLDELDEAWTSPFAYYPNDEMKVFDRYRDFVNFDGGRASGWAGTRINTLEVVLENHGTAVANTNLARLTSDGTELASGHLAFVLGNSNGG